MCNTENTIKEIIENKIRRILVLTSGGDAPGMNQLLHGVISFANAEGIEVYCVTEGYNGLMKGGNYFRKLTPNDVSNLMEKGGTDIYTPRNADEFMEKSGRTKAYDNCVASGIDAIVVIGGDGTFRGARDFVNDNLADTTRKNIPVIGIPATIDGDITATDYTIGFDTAVNTVINCIGKLKDTNESHARCSVIEVMGRGAGYIAINAAIATGAVGAYIPEAKDKFDEQQVIDKIKSRQLEGVRDFVVVVSEGVNGRPPKSYDALTATVNNVNKVGNARISDAIGELDAILNTVNGAEKEKLEAVRKLLAGCVEANEGKDAVINNEAENYSVKAESEKLFDRLSRALENAPECRFLRPAHIIRGGSPTQRDRVTAAKMAEKAIKLLCAGEGNKVICERNSRLVACGFDFVITVDRMFKKKDNEGLEKLTESERAEALALVEQREREIDELYETFCHQS